MDILLEPVRLEQKTILQRLLEFYVYEFSQYIPSIELKEDGTFGFEDLDLYFSSEQYDPYFIRVKDQFAGFAVVKKTNSDEAYDYFMEQFFILKKYQGKGIGSKAAKQVFERYPGRWRVVQIEKNVPAQAFWRNVIYQYTNGNVVESYDTMRRSVQEFDNRK